MNLFIEISGYTQEELLGKSHNIKDILIWTLQPLKIYAHN